MISVLTKMKQDEMIVTASSSRVTLKWDLKKIKIKIKWDLNVKRGQTLKIQGKRVADRENSNFKGPKMEMNLWYLQKRKK